MSDHVSFSFRYLLTAEKKTISRTSMLMMKMRKYHDSEYFDRDIQLEVNSLYD